MTKHTVLIGATKYYEIVFCEFEIRPSYDGDGYKFYANSFTVEPTRVDDVDIEDYYDNLVDDMMCDGKWLWDMCDRYDCKPSDLAWEMAQATDDVQDVLDCSMYPETIIIDGDEWVFESRSYGHSDEQGYITEYVDKDLYNKLHDLWSKYYAEIVDDDIIAEVDELAKKMYHDDTFVENWIADYIERVIM